MTGTPWHQASLVALDLEGTGAQDREHEAILEIAIVPIIHAHPDPDGAYCTLVNPGRPVPTRPWISPGLTDATLRDAPTLTTVEHRLARGINGRYVVGHNIGVDWRLLHRRCPTIQPAGLIDTLRLARHLNTAPSNGLVPLVAANELTARINTDASGSQPHRALWDAIAAATLLATLVQQAWSTPPMIGELTAVAGLGLDEPPAPAATSQPRLFD